MAAYDVRADSRCSELADLLKAFVDRIQLFVYSLAATELTQTSAHAMIMIDRKRGSLYPQTMRNMLERYRPSRSSTHTNSSLVLGHKPGPAQQRIETVVTYDVGLGFLVRDLVPRSALNGAATPTAAIRLRQPDGQTPGPRCSGLKPDGRGLLVPCHPDRIQLLKH
ncbi:MAG: hypothetical protein ACOYEV_01095 [Candidatus Nanopelagicales bacterium]